MGNNHSPFPGSPGPYFPQHMVGGR
jgi:hypothetical protein